MKNNRVIKLIIMVYLFTFIPFTSVNAQTMKEEKVEIATVTGREELGFELTTKDTDLVNRIIENEINKKEDGKSSTEKDDLIIEILKNELKRRERDNMVTNFFLVFFVVVATISLTVVLWIFIKEDRS